MCIKYSVSSTYDIQHAGSIRKIIHTYIKSFSHIRTTFVVGYFVVNRRVPSSLTSLPVVNHRESFDIADLVANALFSVKVMWRPDLNIFKSSLPGKYQIEQFRCNPCVIS